MWKQSENEKPAGGKKQLVLLLVGLGVFQLIAALLALLLWLAGVAWQSYTVAIAALSVLLAVTLVLIVSKTTT